MHGWVGQKIGRAPEHLPARAGLAAWKPFRRCLLNPRLLVPWSGVLSDTPISPQMSASRTYAQNAYEESRASPRLAVEMLLPYYAHRFRIVSMYCVPPLSLKEKNWAMGNRGG